MVEHSQYNIAKNIFSINLGYFKEGQRRMKIAVIQGSSQKEKRKKVAMDFLHCYYIGRGVRRGNNTVFRKTRGKTV